MRQSLRRFDKGRAAFSGHRDVTAHARFSIVNKYVITEHSRVASAAKRDSSVAAFDTDVAHVRNARRDRLVRASFWMEVAEGFRAARRSDVGEESRMVLGTQRLGSELRRVQRQVDAQSREATLVQVARRHGVPDVSSQIGSGRRRSRAAGTIVADARQFESDVADVACEAGRCRTIIARSESEVPPGRRRARGRGSPVLRQPVRRRANTHDQSACGARQPESQPEGQQFRNRLDRASRGTQGDHSAAGCSAIRRRLPDRLRPRQRLF